MNSFRRSGRELEFMVQLLGVLLLSGFVLITAVGFFFGASAAIDNHVLWIINLLLWAVFLVWQLGPVLFEGYSPGLSFREIARYPVSFRLYCFLNCIYGLLDPAALTCLLWLFAMWAAVLVKEPGWAMIAGALFLVFAALNVVSNRIIIGLLERFQSSRRGRELMVVVFLVLMLAPQMVQFIGFRIAKTATAQWLRPVMGAALNLNHVSPPGVVFDALALDAAQKLLPLALLLAWTALALLLFLRQSRAVCLGEIYSEGHVARRELKVRPGWSLPGFDLTIAAIFEKEIRYLKQNLRLVVQLLYPVIFLVIFSQSNGPTRRLFFGSGASGLIGGFAVILLLGVPNMSYNIFGFDNEGFGRWLLSPLPLRKVIFAKNLSHGAIFLTIYLLVSIVIGILFHVSFISALTVTIAFIAVLILQFGAGNVCSARWPKKVDLTKMSSRMASSAAGFTSLLVTMPVGIIGAGVFMAATFLHLAWLPLAASVAGLGIAIFLYSVFLSSTVNYLYGHLEEIERVLSS